MPFSPNQFRSELVFDGARPNLFEVSLQFPTFTNQGNATLASKKLTFMANAAQLPGVTIGQIPLQYFGREVKIAGNRSFADWTLTIINDEDFLVRNAFERWMAGINSHTANLRAGNATNTFQYAVDMSVKQFSKQGGNPIKVYKFVGAWPTDVSPIDLAWGANDTVEEFTVTMAYQFFTDVANGIP